jgi:chromosomal replication initiator protein
VENAIGLGAEWARVRGQLRQEFGEAAFRSWLKPLTFAGAAEGEIRITVPTRFLRDWVMSHYAERIQALWREENPDVGNVVILVEPGGATEGAAVQPAPPAVPVRRRPTRTRSRSTRCSSMGERGSARLT